MTWQIIWDDRARRELRRLDHRIQEEILRYMREKVGACEDPGLFGKPMTGDYKGYWRYRIGDYRVICKIRNNEMTITAIKVGHRKNIYG